MVRLERNKQIEAAVKRAAQAHNHVTPMGNATYLVKSGDSGEEYSVRLLKGLAGFAWAICNCKAGQKQMACKHIISAGWVHKGIIRMRKS